MGNKRALAWIQLIFLGAFVSVGSGIAQDSGGTVSAVPAAAETQADAAIGTAAELSALRVIRISGSLPAASAGMVGVTFALYREQEDGSPLWMETQNVSLDAQGRYSVLLGSTKPEGLPQGLFSAGEARWLGMQTGSEPEQPRILFVSVPYALKAADAETLGGQPLSAFVLRDVGEAGAPGDASAEFSTAEAGVTPRLFEGSGTTNFISKFLDATTLGDSLFFDNGVSVGLGTTEPAATLDVAGTLKAISLLLDLSLDLPATVNAATGVIRLNGAPFLHGFGANNTFVGQNAGNFNSSGIDNTASGNSALSSNTFGFSNTAMGSGALLANTSGNSNTAVGESALRSNTSAIGNTAVGTSTLRANTTGGANTATGAFALQTNTVGSNNTAMGRSALFTNSVGSSNTATGSAALLANTSGNSNTATGASALSFNSTGSSNTASGAFALTSNTTGSSNTASGAFALQTNTTGNSNTADGRSALFSNTTGSSNTATGLGALFSNTTGSGNTAHGAIALASNTLGILNTATGSSSLVANTEGNSNTATGSSALLANTTGGGNTASGAFALQTNTTGAKNTASGAFALQANTIGNENIAIGSGSLFLNTTGENNTAVGSQAGVTHESANANIEGSLNTFIGYNAGPGVPVQLTNATAIGANALVSAHNSVVLGDSAVKVGIRTAAPVDTLQVVGDIRVGTSGTNGCLKDFSGAGIAGVCSSDVRLKKNIRPFSRVLEKVAQLQPVSYDWRADEYPEYHFGDSRAEGLVAQDVEKVLPEMVSTDARGYKAVDYSALPMLMLEAIRELKAENDALRQQIQAQQKQFMTQGERIRQLEAGITGGHRATLRAEVGNSGLAAQ